MSRVAESAYGDALLQDLQPDLFRAPQALSPPGIPADLATLFEQIALDLIRRGIKCHSSDAILHRIRWFHHVERGDSNWKCNNNYTSILARWFIKKHPAYSTFFETRERAP